MDVFIIVVLTVLNGAFAMSEMAVSASKRLRLVALGEAGDHGAVKALELMDSPTRFLSTVQIGITSIGMLNGIVGEAAFSDGLAAWIREFGVAEKPAQVAATGIVVVIITYTTIVFGELVPKRIGQMYPELVARWVAPTMGVLATVARPFVALLSASTALVLKLLRVDRKHAQEVTEEEIQASLKEGVDAGVIEAAEHQMVRNVFHLDDQTLTAIMVPRAQVQWIDASKSIASASMDARARLQKDAKTLPPSWFPVCRGGLDDVIGIVGLVDLFAASDDNATVETLARPATFAPETLSGLELLEQFRRDAVPMVCVVDEYGSVQGIATSRDVLEAITGEASRVSAAAGAGAESPSGPVTLDGSASVATLKSSLGLSELPGEDDGHYSTVGGLVVFLLQRLAVQGDVVELGHWRLEVKQVSARKVVQVVAKAL